MSYPSLKSRNFFSGEVSPVVSDDTVGNAESVDDVKEFDCLLRPDVGDGFGLYPLYEFVDHYE